MSSFDISLDLDIASPTYGDFKLSGNDLSMVNSQLTAIQQHALQRLRTYLGEWFLDLSIGVDYFGQILVKNPDAGISEAILKSTIVNTPGVTALLSFKLTQNYSNRILNLQFSAATTHGTISYEGIL